MHMIEEPALLSEQEIEVFVAANPDWKFENDRLVASFKFESFESAIEVVNKIAKVCTEMDHHPLMTNVYNKLMFSICTHRAGDKVTELDKMLAERISEIVESPLA